MPPLTLAASLFRLAGRRPSTRRWRITGPYRGITGYDRVVRALVPLLQQRGVQVEIQELRNWSPTKMSDRLPLPFRRSRSFANADLHLHFGLPTQVVCSPECRNINFSMFEADRIPSSWVDATEKIDLVVVPTESSRQSWINGGVSPTKVRLCPEGADFRLFTPAAPALQLETALGRPVSSYRNRFLNIAEFITRKNLRGLLRVWLKCTTAADDAVLILKPGFYVSRGRELFTRTFGELEAEAGKSFARAAPIVVCDRQLTEAEIPGLYTSATHYWSMSFGEGFDLPMVEAAACDLQLIAPDHSAYRSYLTPENSFLCPAETVDALIPDDPGLAALFRGSKWWRPLEAQAGAIIRAVIDGTAPRRPSSRASLQPTCRFENMADELLRLLADETSSEAPGFHR